MRTIAVINQKGGVGKSTTAHALGAGLFAQSARVLFCDLDMQSNLSYACGVSNASLSAMQTLLGVAALEETLLDIQPPTAQTSPLPSSIPCLHLLPGGPSLAGADMQIQDTGKEYRLTELLASIQDRYDYAIIDTPPALGILTINALTACDGVIVPAQADIYSLQGIGQLHGTLSAVQRYTNPRLVVLGVLLTRYSPRAVLSRDITILMEDTAQQLDTQVFDTRIRECIALREAQASQQDIFTYAPKSNAAQDYTTLIGEILERIQPQ